MTTLSITDALPSDLEAMIRLTQTTHDEHAATSPERFVKGAEAHTVQWFRSHFATDQNPSVRTRVIVCRDTDQSKNSFVGHVLLAFWKVARGPDAHDLLGSIYDISVVPQRRNEGVGRKLMAHAQDILRSEGATVAVATVRHGNLGSEQLFNEGGYRIISKEFALRILPPLQGVIPDLAGEELRAQNRRKMLITRAFAVISIAVFIFFGFLAWYSS